MASCSKLPESLMLCSRSSDGLRRPRRLPISAGRRRIRSGGLVVVSCKRNNNSVDTESAEEKIERLANTVERLKARIAELEPRVGPSSSLVYDSKRQQAAATAPASQFSAAATCKDSQRTCHPLASGINTELERVADIVWPSPSDKTPFWKRGRLRTPHEAAPGSCKGVGQDADPIHIIHVTAEMAPVAKVGGLGDVVTGLSRACIARGHRVEVMLPYYECLPKEHIQELSSGEVFQSFHKGAWAEVQMHKGKIAGVPVLLVEPKNQFFKGLSIYGGCYEEVEAYLFYCRACLEWMQVTNHQPDIIHVHEWHTGAIPMLYWDMYHHLSLKKPRLVLTIHNMEHHGECKAEQLNMCGLDGAAYRVADKAVDDRTIGHNPERLSLLKGGIVFSNAFTTVSPTYVNETLCSGWLSSTLLKHRSKYFGILNGIDTQLWDPTTDPYLPAEYEENSLRGKHICKIYLQKGLGLDPDDLPTRNKSHQECKRSPLVVCVTRLVAQKGIHLIRHAMYRLEQLSGQFVLLGTTPDPRLKSDFEKLADKFAVSRKVRLLLTYSEELAHLLYAAADIVLVPSMFEPCGLTQMIGMRYGAVPVVRKTGGLADTVFDVQYQNNTEIANGFVFEGIDERSLDSALERAVQLYRESPHSWQALVSKVMRLDNSWDKSAKEYIGLYNSVRVK